MQVVKKSTLFLGCLLCAATQALAPLDVRIALVVGNSSYLHAPVLLNPSNDAKAVSVALKKSGFTVYQVLDGTQVEMRAAVDKITGELKGKQAIALFYYAGRGLQLDWRNYMMPVNAKLSKAVDVPLQTVDVGAVVDNFKLAGTRMNIVVLDACRDNPFASTASAKGLAPMDAPPRTILAYATAPGNVAEDGDAVSGNGLYPQFLV